MRPILRASATTALMLVASLAHGGECSRWLPGLDADCERAQRPAGFAAPVASPFLFEDAFVVTGAQALYARQEIPTDSVLGGGEVEVAAGQLRLALTSRLALVGTKLGAMWTRPENPFLPARQAPIPITLGLKLALRDDAERGRWAALTLRYGDAFQGGSDGALLPSLAGAARAGDFALQGDVGGSWALDRSFSSFVFWHANAGFARWRRITPFFQLSGQHWIDGGDGSATLPLTPLGQQYFQATRISMRTVEGKFGTFEGADLVNLGAREIAGKELVTAALGAELRYRNLALAVAYELPLTSHRGAFENRVTTSLSLQR